MYYLYQKVNTVFRKENQKLESRRNRLMKETGNCLREALISF